MLSTLITSKTRIKLLMKFFINSKVNGYLRSLESEFGESTNAIRLELNRFEKAGLLTSTFKGNKKIYQANAENQYYNDLQDFLHRIIGIDHIKENILKKIPGLEAAYLTGKLANGIDSQLFDLLLIGNKLDQHSVSNLAEEFENNGGRKIRFLILTKKEINRYIDETVSLKIWEKKENLTS